MRLSIAIAFLERTMPAGGIPARGIPARGILARGLLAKGLLAKGLLASGLLAAGLLAGAPLAALAEQPGATGPAFGEAEMIRHAIDAYRHADIEEGDATAALIRDGDARLALEWAALRLGGRKLSFRRISSFLAAHPDFPMRDWLHRRGEDVLAGAQLDSRTLERYFDGREPEMASGKLALALDAERQKRHSRAMQLVRAAWRENRLPADVMRGIERAFPEAIGPADSAWRALRLIYAGESREGLRFAEKAGPATLALARALDASIDGRRNAEALLAKVPPEAAGTPAALFVRVQILRRKDKLEEAAALIGRAPADAQALIDGEAWWDERRALARALLDDGKAAAAYAVADGATAISDADRVEADFHAGWIALRFLGKPRLARRHFERAGDAARTPLSLARANYWLGRAADAGGGGDAVAAYRLAAQHSTTYYGQLAAARLGAPGLTLPERFASAADLQRFAESEAGRAIRVLFEADAVDLAQPLVLDLARTVSDPATLDALGTMIAGYNQPRLLTLAGKLAMQRGLPLAQHAFPAFGVPRFASLEGAADSPMVYAVARQESEFNAGAVSHAGARGLMQMMPATAQRTARAFGVAFDVRRLSSDAAYNAQLGAAHLGELLREQRGSYILTFAAYNAGGRRVKEWIAAYGDPRTGAVDPIDWVERIPFSETRNYVQRVMENLQVYRVRLNRQQALLIDDDLRRADH